MKKMNMKTVMALTLAFSVLGGTAAYADVMKGESTPTLIARQEPEIKQEVAYHAEIGKIVSLPSEEMDSYTVEIANENGGLLFALSPTTTLVNRENGSLMTMDQLEKDMEVMVVYPADTPVGMSLPPYVGNIQAVVVNPTKGSISIGTFDEELINVKDKVQLHIDKTTNILTTLGTKSILDAKDIVGKNAIVFYDAATKSIPAQTTPSFVLLLEEKEAAEPKEKTVDADTAKKTPKLVALRDAAKEKGYTVTWQGKTKPVILKKGDKTVSITIGKADYVVEGDMVYTAKMNAKLVNGVLHVSSEVVDVL